MKCTSACLIQLNALLSPKGVFKISLAQSYKVSTNLVSCFSVFKTECCSSVSNVFTEQMQMRERECCLVYLLGKCMFTSEWRLRNQGLDMEHPQWWWTKRGVWYRRTAAELQPCHVSLCLSRAHPLYTHNTHTHNTHTTHTYKHNTHTTQPTHNTHTHTTHTHTHNRHTPHTHTHRHTHTHTDTQTHNTHTHTHTQHTHTHTTHTHACWFYGLRDSPYA